MKRSGFAVIVFSFCSLCLCGESPGGNWPQFLGHDRNGTSTEKGLLQTWSEKGPPLLWQKNVGEGYSGPVVSGTDLVLFHRVGDEDVVECLNPANSERRWKYAYATSYRDLLGKGNGPRSTPLIAGNRVFALGAQGKMLCLNRKTGELLWERNLNDDYKVRPGYFGVGTSPLLEQDLILVNVGGKGAGIVALDAATGKEVWKATDHEASYSSPVAATIDGTRHVLFLTREGLVSVNPENGAVRFSKHWRARINESVNAATPVVAGGHVFVSACYQTGAGLFKVRKDGVDEVWANDESLSNHYNTSVQHDGFLYGFDGRQEEGPHLRCVEWLTGKVRWTRKDPGCGSMILADGNLIVLTEDGDLLLVEATPKEYREKAKASLLHGPCRAQPALADGKLYARDRDKLYCWDLKK
jgi:outer membrane protein assembly factor BamB